MNNNSKQSIDDNPINTKLASPQDIQFYFKSSWYLLGLILVIEFIVMLGLSRVDWAYSNWAPWAIRAVVFGFIFSKIAKKFKQLNLALLGSILGMETGLIVAIAKIIINSAAQWTWFNLLTEPFYLMGLGAVVGMLFKIKDLRLKI